MSRRRLRRGTVLGDLQMGGQFGGRAPAWQPAPEERSGVGVVIGPTLSPGVAGEIARSVQQIPFSDSISPSYPLECFFVMPPGVVSIRSVKVYAQRDEFRRYVSAVSGSAASGGGVTSSGGGGGGTSSGGGAQTSSGGGAHNHALGRAQISSGGPSTNSTSNDTPTTGAQQSLHTHAGGATEAQNHSHLVTHGHTMGSHTHTEFASDTLTGQSTDHTHTVVNHTHTTDVHTHNTDTTHNHTITTTLTAGIFEESLSGTISLYVANDGTNFAGPVVSGQTTMDGVDVTSYFTKAPGARRIRIDGTALMRVHVLVVMDVILELGV